LEGVETHLREASVGFLLEANTCFGDGL